MNQGFGNFDQLLLSGAEPAAGLIQVHFDSHPSEEGRHLLPFAAAGHEASGSHFLAQENVLHRCERRNEIELLVNHRHTGRAGFLRGLKSSLLAVDSQRARIGGVGPSDNLH